MANYDHIRWGVTPRGHIISVCLRSGETFNDAKIRKSKDVTELVISRPNNWMCLDVWADQIRYAMEVFYARNS